MFRGFTRGRGRSRGMGSRQNLGLALLAFQIFQFGIDRIPLVTLITILTNVGVYLHVPELFDIHLPKVSDVCISYQGVIVYREYPRLLLSGFYHLTDMHLYFNMASFLYKGTQLEPRLGSGKFASVIGVLVVGSSAVYCALQYLAAQALGPGHLHSCAAGFSCVLFGLKVILQNNSPPSHRLFGLPIHMAYWSELIWISVISPNVSFVGHLAGIVTGLLITHGPLNFLLAGTLPGFFEGGVRNNNNWGGGVASGRNNQPRRGNTQPRSASSQPRSENVDSNNLSSLNLNAAEEAELQEAIRRSLEDPDPLNPGYNTGPAGYGNTGYNAPTNRLYPDIPAAQPSAPPQDHNNHHDQYHAPHDPSQAPALPNDLDDIRRRRIQRFQ